MLWNLLSLLIKNPGILLEIYISTPIEECKRIDPKGLYSKIDAGEIINFTGIDDPYEVPEKPLVSINTINLSMIRRLGKSPVMKQK